MVMRFFAESLYTNCGLFLLNTGRVEQARMLLEVAREIAPWSAEAAANLAVIRRTLGDREGAIELFKVALQLRPGSRVFAEALEHLECEVATLAYTRSARPSQKDEGKNG